MTGSWSVLIKGRVRPMVVLRKNRRFWPLPYLFYLCQIALLHLASLNHPGLTIIWFDSRSYASAYDSFEVKMHETMPNNRKSISNIFQARSTSYSDLEVAIEVVLVLVLYLY